MRRIRPFIGPDLVKVMTGIRRCGKSVMLDLIKEELKESGISAAQFITFNFEDMRNANFCTATALHDEVVRRASEISGKVYLFFYQIQHNRFPAATNTGHNLNQICSDKRTDSSHI